MSDPIGDAEQCFLEYGVRPARVDRDSAGNLLIDLGDESLLVGQRTELVSLDICLGWVDKQSALDDRLPMIVDEWTFNHDRHMVAILPLDVLARLVARCQDV